MNTVLRYIGPSDAEASRLDRGRAFHYKRFHLVFDHPWFVHPQANNPYMATQELRHCFDLRAFHPDELTRFCF